MGRTSGAQRLGSLSPTKGNAIGGEGTVFGVETVGADGQVITANAAATRGFDWQSVAGLGLGYALFWGAELNGAVGQFAIVNGIHDTPSGVSSLIQSTEVVIPEAGTAGTLTFNTQGITGTTVLKLHKNGAVAETINPSGGSRGTESLSTAVVLGDRLAIEWDAGNNPNKGTYSIFIE